MTIRVRPRSKYGAVKTVVDGITFASKREAKRFSELKLLERADAIRGLELQPSYPLSIATDDPHAPKQVAVYRADFAYVDVQTGRVVVEDVKGVRTPVYRLKKKMVEAQYGIRVVEI